MSNVAKTKTSNNLVTSAAVQAVATEVPLPELTEETPVKKQRKQRSDKGQKRAPYNKTKVKG